MRGGFLMAELVHFMERSARSRGQKVDALHPLAKAAMQQTGEMGPQKKGHGSQRFLQGGLSAPITVTWEITAACNIACIHCLSSSGRRRPRELTREQALALVDELADMQVFQIHFGGGEPFIFPCIWQALQPCPPPRLVMFLTPH